MTPHIVRQYEKVRAILDKKLKERDEFIESTAGGNDLLRYKRDDLIRNLPDIKERMLTQGATPTPTTPEAFDAFIREEVKRFAKVLIAAGARVN